MVSSCAAINCTARFVKEGQLKFHRFPKDSSMRNKWISATRRKNFVPTANTLLCSKHFKGTDYEESVMGSIHLKKDSVPSLFDFSKHLCKSEKVRRCLKRKLNIGADKNQENVMPNVKYEVDSFVCPENEILEDEPVIDCEFEPELTPILQRPIGEEAFRVCRTCLKIMKVTDTVPLVVNEPGMKDNFYGRLLGILESDLLPLENACVCKNCESFINAVHNFKVMCNTNENVLKEFDWGDKTKDLLHIVDQDLLRTMYNEYREAEEILANSKIEENVAPLPTEDNSRVEVDWDRVWRELDEKGNGLSDMEDHWYHANENKGTDHDCTSQKITHSATSLLKDEIHIFSPTFEDYFKKVGGKLTKRMKRKIKYFHLNDEGTGPFICEFCGQLNDSKKLYIKHMKVHTPGGGFHCQECDKVLAEWTSYTNHCKLEHGGFPKSFKCQLCNRKYHRKKLLDNHKKIHKFENSNYNCLICREPFDSQRDFEIHRAVHRPQKYLCKLCGLYFFKNDLDRHIKLKHSSAHFSRFKSVRKLFKCNICERKYFKKGCLDLHKKQSHKEVDSATCPSYSVQKNKVEDTLEDFVGSYEITVGDVKENVTIVFDE